MENVFVQKLGTVNGIVWDLDNTLYRLEEVTAQAFHKAVARAVIEAGLDLDLARATDMARQSYHTYGYSGRVFVKEYGIDDVWLHHRFHDHIDENILARDAEIVGLFEQSHLQHALITHGSGIWARRALAHLGLSRWFRDDCILALENYGFEKKSDSARSFMQVLERMQLPPEQTLFVEDTLRNLSIPHRLGMGTVLVHHGQKPADMPVFIDAEYNNALELLRDIMRHKAV